jgi:hypothetical protein
LNNIYWAAWSVNTCMAYNIIAHTCKQSHIYTYNSVPSVLSTIHTQFTFIICMILNVLYIICMSCGSVIRPLLTLNAKPCNTYMCTNTMEYTQTHMSAKFKRERAQHSIHGHSYMFITKTNARIYMQCIHYIHEYVFSRSHTFWIFQS